MQARCGLGVAIFMEESMELTILTTTSAPRLLGAKSGGERGIRTPVSCPTSDFESGAFARPSLQDHPDYQDALFEEAELDSAFRFQQAAFEVDGDSGGRFQDGRRRLALWDRWRRRPTAGHTGVDQGAETHQTGLKRDVERGATQTVVAQVGRSVAQGLDFRMGGRIIQGHGAVVASARRLAFHHENGANGDFILIQFRSSSASRMK